MSPFLTFGNIRRRNIYPSPTALPPTSPPLPPPPSYQSIQEQDQKPSLHRYFIQQKLTTHEFIHLWTIVAPILPFLHHVVHRRRWTILQPYPGRQVYIPNYVQRDIPQERRPPEIHSEDVGLGEQLTIFRMFVQSTL
ncbi:hypothetical protein I204_03493 [Kwoniella mangroviensis CBS 8886]|nr:hypothetical protein I204_03493 [Kwoniella mangroviensis CBS 8886]